MGVESGQESDLQIQPGEAGGVARASAAAREKVTLNQESSWA